MGELYEGLKKGLETIGPVGFFLLVGYVVGLKMYLAHLRGGGPPIFRRGNGQSYSAADLAAQTVQRGGWPAEIANAVHAKLEETRQDVARTRQTAEDIEHRQETFNVTAATTAQAQKATAEILARIEVNLQNYQDLILRRETGKRVR